MVSHSIVAYFNSVLLFTSTPQQTGGSAILFARVGMSRTEGQLDTSSPAATRATSFNSSCLNCPYGQVRLDETPTHK